MASTWQSRRAWAKYLGTKNAPGVFNFDPDAFLIARPPYVAANSMNGKYNIELCRPGGEDTGIERVFERQDELAIARKLYRTIATEYPGRVVMLCDRARVLARSDRGTLPGSSEFNPRGRSPEETA
jgi:hypothetical protein